MSRLENTGKNAIWATAANLLYTLLGIVGRYIFLMVLDETYLGISSLFSSIIGALSFVDLGLSSAFTFCFYKPIAENDIPHIQALLKAFKRVIGFIALFIGLGGIALIPFLRVLVKGGDNISDTMLVVYYLITLGNTVLSYWLVYKTCYITAAQKAYKLVPFNIAARLATVLLQLAALVTFKSYTAWALSAPIVTVVHYIIMNEYIKRAFPETKFKKADKLPEEDKKSILNNVRGLIIDRFGEICVCQTDSIIVSSMVSIATTGLISNYELIKSSVLSIVKVVQNAVVPGLGDLIASEDAKVQKNVLYTYMMINYCMVGFAMCGIGVLSSPFISLLFGADKTVDDFTITLMCIGFYFAYQTYALNAFPTAAGKLTLGVWSSFVEGISNLLISIAAVKVIGLPGVYVGTVASQVINYVIRGFTTFKGIYSEKPYKYFKDTLSYFASAMLAYIILWGLKAAIIGLKVSIWNFALLTLLTPVVFYGVAWLIWGRSEYGQIVVSILKQTFSGIRKNDQAI